MSATKYEDSNGKPLKPEFLKIREAAQVFGIGKTSLYELINARKVRSVLLRKRGQVSGTRLLSYDSLKNYLESLAEEE